MIRIGLLGAARIAPMAIIAPVSKRSDCEIVAVGCRSLEKGIHFITENHLSAEIMDYAALCTHPDIDAIYIALPPSAHERWACLAMENGKAVLCEKPAAMGAKDARVMAEVSRRTGQPFMEAFHYYFHPAFESSRDDFKYEAVPLARETPPPHFLGHFTAPIPKTETELRYKAELGGGALMDLGCYPLHAMRQLFGEPELISARAVIEGGIDVALVAEFSYDDMSATIQCDMRGSAERKDYLELAKPETDGTLFRYSSFVAPHRGYAMSSMSGQIIYEAQKTGRKSWTTYVHQLNHFIDVMRGMKPKLSLDDMVAQASLIEDIYKKVELR